MSHVVASVISSYIASNGTLIDGLEASNHTLIEILSRKLTGGGTEEDHKTPKSEYPLSDFQIRTESLLNTILEC
jgi:hypothetical protein